MASEDPLGTVGPAAPGPGPVAEPPRTRWQKVRLVVKVVELRLRFVLLMAITGLVFAYWDTIWNRYEKWTRPATAAHAPASGLEYYCPMHPQVTQDEPGSCPICGMPLARRKKGVREPLPEGVVARLQLAPFRMAQAGIRTAEVGYAPLMQTLTTVGFVTYDERRLARIPAQVPGKTRVVTLFANYNGMHVRKGEPLAELYSPELAQAIQELLQNAKRSSQEPRGAVGKSLLGDRRELVRLSAEKLKRWGITQAQIDEILRTRRADFKVPVLAPIGGHLIAKNVVEGQEVAESFPMFEVADLGRVWVKARVFEHQVDLVHEGQAVSATVEALPGRTFTGRVEFAQPHLDLETRTLEVWYALENPDHKLRPGMFATVTLKTPVAELPGFRARRAAAVTAEGSPTCPVTGAKLGSMGAPVVVEISGRKVATCCKACPPKLRANPARYLRWRAPAARDEVLSVPESAVIDTGRRQVVYVEAEPGVFEGRQVVLGPRVGDRFPVLEGLAPGEHVAAEGAFLIDAESRLNPAAPPVQAGAHRH